MIRRILVGLLGLVVLAIVGLAGFLFVSPPLLLRVADGYAAKIICSNVFLANRDANAVLADDVQAPGNPILKTILANVDTANGVVTTRILGLFATGTAVYRPGLGCADVPDGDVAKAKAVAIDAPTITPLPADAIWPAGEAVGAANDKVQALLGDAGLTGPGMRAVVVVKDGAIVAETYAPGFDAKTPLIGWSMSKTVNAILAGTVVGAGKLALTDTGLFPQWANDDRKTISFANMAAMTPGLDYVEDYGDVTDTTRMLYLEPDMAGFVAAKPLKDKPGTVFNYSTGTAMLISRLWMDRIGDAKTALSYPRTALFAPLGMNSAVFEADEAGTIGGGSYLYATGRDWARIGQFLLQDGVWNGQRLLPEGFVALMHTSNGLDGGYSQMQSWVMGPHESDDHVDAGLPKDAFWLRGHDGQTVTVIPSKGLVVVRMGLTPWALGYWPEKLVKAVVDALG